MSWIAAAIFGGSVVGGLISSHGAQSAADTQASAANHAADVQLQMFNQTRDDQAPWRQAGANALGTIGSGSAYFNHTFDANDLNANLAPNYKFMLDQGLGATTNMANAMGGLGGNSLKAVNDYAQNYASNAYQQAFTNYTSNQTNIFNRLASIAGLGQTAGSNQTTGGSQYGASIGNAITGAGNARAAGIVGSANAISGALTNGVGMYALSNMFRPAGGTSWATSNSGPGWNAEGGPP